MNKIKICILGCGGFNSYAHGPSCRLVRDLHPDVEYPACCDLDPERAEKYAARFGIPRFYTDWREMADKENPHGICMITPVSLTSKLACEVLNYGIPLMMEKPPGRNREEIMAIVETSRRTGVPAMVALNRRYSPLLNQMLDIWKNEAACEPVEHVRCDFYRPERLDDDFSTTAIHGIDALRHISGGSFCSADFVYQKLNRPKSAYNIYMNAVFDNGAYGFISFLPSTGVRFERYTLSTRNWTLIANTVPPQGGADVPGKIEVFCKGNKLRDEAPKAHPFSGIEIYLGGYYSENESFAQRLKNGFPDDNDLLMSLDAVELADCVRKQKTHWERG